MDPLAVTQIEAACTRLSIAYARHVDFGEYDAFAALFTEDGHLDAGGPLDGRERIREAMSQRSDALRSRHVLTNIWIDVVDDSHARGISYLTLYRHVGEESREAAPVALDGPAAIGHYSDEFCLTADGWRIARRTLSMAFVNRAAFPPRRS